MNSRVFMVMLRRPGKGDPRTDPFWEFGSFGCTGCHGKNLLHPKNCQIRDGDRLAFVQYGPLGTRLLLVTPAITRIDHVRSSPIGRVELRWEPSQKPFRYDRALPLFESASPGRSVPCARLAASLDQIARSTIHGRFASRFRARSSPLESELARELVAAFNSAVRRSVASDFITRYEEALPWCDCPSSTAERHSEYRRMLRTLQGSAYRRQRKPNCRT